MASPTVHLMWKEYRTLRTLWASVVGVATLIFLASIMASYQLTWMDVAGSALFTVVVAVGLFVPVALCMAFTLETEERTSLLLFQLAPTWRQLMAGKLIPVFSAAFALLPAICLTAGAITLLIWLFLPNHIRSWNDSATAFVLAPKPGEYIGAAVSVYALLVGPAMFLSFTMRKVVSAVVASFLAIVFLYALMIIGFSEFGVPVVSVVWALSLIPVGLMSVAWHRGKLPTAFQSFSNPAIKVGATSTSLRPSRVARLLSFQTWLLRLSQQQESHWRVARVLLWKEVRTSIGFLLGWPLIMLLFAILTQSAAPGFRAFWMALLASLFCQECGLRTFRSEHSEGTLLFGSHRGVSPQLTWLVKAGFGLTIALLMTKLFFAIDSFVPVRIQDISWLPGEHVSGIHYLQKAMDTRFGPGIHAGANFFRIDLLPFTMVTACFVCGLISSAWIGRSILSFGGAAGLNTALWLIVTQLCIRYDLPMHRLLWPVMLTWAGMSLLTVRSTVELRHSWRLDGARIAVMAVSVVVAILAAGAIRAYQVPGMISVGNPTFFGRPLTQSPLYQLNGNIINVPETSVDPHSVNPSIKQLWQWIIHAPSLTRVATISHLAPSPDLLVVLPISDPVDAERMEALIEAFEQMRQLSDDQLIESFDQELLSPRSLLPSPIIAQVAVNAARSHTATGQHLEAGKCMLDGIRIIRLLNQLTANWDQWTTNCIAERTVLRELAEWAAGDEISFAELKEVFQALRTVAATEMSPIPMLNNRYYYWVALMFDPAVANDQPYAVHGALQNWQQTWRVNRFRYVKTLNVITALTSREFGGNDVAQTLTIDETEIPAVNPRLFLHRVLWSMPDYGQDLESDPLLRHDNIQDSAEYANLLATVRAERATMLILELQAYRRQHGGFPKTLDDLRSDSWTNAFSANGEMLQRTYFSVPGSGDTFGYSAAGMDTPMVMPDGKASVRILQPGQPVLWSGNSPDVVDFDTRNRFAALWFGKALAEATSSNFPQEGHPYFTDEDGHTILWVPVIPERIDFDW